MKLKDIIIKIILVSFFFIIMIGTLKAKDVLNMHTANSGDFNLTALEQIENFIGKKTGIDFNNYKDSFTLNGYNFNTRVDINRFSPSTYEESFSDTKNPENEFRVRLVKYLNGDQELAIYIHEGNKEINCHAAFDSQGNMLSEDPWGKTEGYTIEIFNLYDKYRKTYYQKVNANN